MKLKYKILWVEDEKDWVDSEVEFIKEYLELHGFSLDLNNIEKYESEDFSTFDLIVVDYNLAEGETGAKVIEKIREQELYTEILFYSSDGESFLRGQIKNLELDGIYCASKNSCREKMKGVIYTTIRKTQDLNNIRGLVMSETSKIDNIMKEILLLCKDKYNLTTSNSTFCKSGGCSACSYCQKKTKEFKDSNNDVIFSLIKGPTVANTVRGANSGALLTGVISFLDSGIHISAFTSNDIQDYRNDIKRNLLAHYEETSYSQENNSYTIIDDDNVPHTFDEAIFSDMRNSVRRYRDVFEKILTELTNITA